MASLAAAQANVVWKKSYEGPAGEGDIGYAVALDIEKNVYVTGSSTGLTTGSDLVVIKYNPDGVRQWVRRYARETTYTDIGEYIEVDGSGNVYVCGRSASSTTSWDIVTLKYDTNGNKLWSKVFSGNANSTDQPSALHVDRAGNVTMVGTTAHTTTGYDWVTIRYDRDGNRIWFKRFAGTSANEDYGTDVAMDQAGDLLVSGYSIGTSTAPGFDLGVIKYDPTAGSVIWDQSFKSTEPESGAAYAVVVDGSNNVYVAGTAKFATNGYDGVLTKYDSAGRFMWRKRYHRGTDDGIVFIKIDDTGSLIMAGYTNGANDGYDYWTIKTDSNGVKLWTNVFGSGGNGADWVRGLAVDHNENICLTGDFDGEAGTIKYDANGNVVWSYTTDQQGNGIAVDADGYVYVVGNDYHDGGNWNIMTIKLSP